MESPPFKIEKKKKERRGCLYTTNTFCTKKNIYIYIFLERSELSIFQLIKKKKKKN